MNTFGTLTSSVLTLAMALGGQSVLAQDGTNGLAQSDEAEISSPSVDVGLVRPFRTFVDSGLYSAGVGLRNRLSGGIEISGIPPGTEMRLAWLYWNIITASNPTRAERRIFLERVSPTTSPRRRLTGNIVGQGDSPCWGGSLNTVLRALVPAVVLDGNGTYLVTVPAIRFGRTDGSIPWGNILHPSINGASMFVVTEGTGEVMLYDRPLVGQMFSDTLSYQLQVPTASANASSSVLHFANSDGQTGSGLSPSPSTSSETVSVNGVLISGPGSPVLQDSDWNGDEGSSYTQLWDNVVHNATNFVSSSATPIAIEVNAASDCLVPVAVGLARD